MGRSSGGLADQIDSSSLQGLGADPEAGVAGDDEEGGAWEDPWHPRLLGTKETGRPGREEGRKEGLCGDLARSSPELGEGGLARETEGSGAAARSPCRWRQASKQRTRGSPDPSPPTHPALPRWPACDEPLRGVRRGITRGGALQPPPSPTTLATGVSKIKRTLVLMVRPASSRGRRGGLKERGRKDWITDVCWLCLSRNLLKLKMKRNSWKRKRNDMVEIHSHISGS
ncbi:uncharacterized protein [Triticum aestivum]|uniref:uncharacterized protein n=1 Tax=Triticum aestivum TaxID=4565 RepID=UPI001D02B94E|nr:uncharacterized protein LOC123191389 [Triticum aestivum]